MPAGLGGGGYMALSLEATSGTYQDPATAGTIFIPILEEGFTYREDKYYSPQIRQTTIVSDVAQSYYHVEGDVRMEIDPNFIPYIYYCSRHTITKTGAGPYVYKFVPSNVASVVSGVGATARTASVTFLRNGIGFGYSGCVFGGYELTIDNGVLVGTFNMLGLSEQTPGALGTPVWVDPHLFGAAAHSVYVAASGTAPTFVTADVNFNGFTFTANFNAAAQNRIVPDRAATYISFGETEATYTTELDFVDKTEYNNMLSNTTRAIRLESLRGGVSFAAATEAHRITVDRSSYDTYDVSLGGMGDLIMAGVTGRVIGIAGGDAYSIEVKSAANIT